MKSVSKFTIALSLVLGLTACNDMLRDTGTASAPAASAVSAPAASEAIASVPAKAEFNLDNFDITDHLGDKEMGIRVAAACKAEGPNPTTGEYKSKICNEIYNDLNSPCNLEATSHNPFCDAINEDTEDTVRETTINNEMKRAEDSAAILNHPTAVQAQGITLAEKCHNSAYASNECRTAVRYCANSVKIENEDKCRGMDAYLQSKGTGLLRINASLPAQATQQPQAANSSNTKPWPNGLEPTRANANKCASDSVDPEFCNVIFQICQDKRDSRSKHPGCPAFLDAAEH